MNVKGEETSFYEKQHKKTFTINFSGIKNVKKKSYVLVEDVISMTKEEEINLRKAINYTVHHNQAKLFCVSHTITKTGIYSMVGLFNYIIFTGSPSNLPVIRTCLKYFKIENDIVNRWLSSIKKESKRDGRIWDPYYFFDCTRMIFCVSDDLLNLNGAQGFKILGSLSESSTSEDGYDDDDDDDDDYDDEINQQYANFLSNQVEGYRANQPFRSRQTGKRKGTSDWALAGSSEGSDRKKRGSDGKALALPIASCGASSRWKLGNSYQSSETECLKRANEKKLERKKNLLRLKKLELIKKKFSSFFSGHELQNQACAVFSLIVEKIDVNRVDGGDLSITFKSKEAEKKKKISLVDYIASLLVPNKPPSMDHLVLHNFVTSQCVLPVSCIRNENFLLATKR